MTRKLSRITSCLALVVVCGAVCQGCADWSADAVAESQRRGNAIVAAIDAYKKDHGAYPTDLGELVPEYLSKIDPPTAGSQVWGYGVYKNGAVFCLWFEGPTKYHPFSGYSSSSRNWMLDTK